MIRAALLWPVKIAVVTAVVWYALRDPLPTPVDWIVSGLVAVLVYLAYAASRTGIRRTGDSHLLHRAGIDPLADGKRVALPGTLTALGPVLRAPFSQTECVGYSYEVYHTEYTPARSRAGTSTTRKVTDLSGLSLAPCAIHTLQGDYRLLSFPFLSGFPEQTYTDAESRSRASNYMRSTSFEKTMPYIGELAALNRAMLDETGSVKKDWKMTDSDDLSDSTIAEQCIPAGKNVCAFGVYSEAKRSLVADTASDSRSVLLVAGTPEEAARKLASGTRSSWGLALVTAAPALGIVAFLLFAPWTMIRAVPGSSLIIEKQTDRLRDALDRNDLREIAAAVRYLDPNIAFEEASRTPLMLSKSVEAADLLIRRGASVTAHDAGGYSVLMNVAERGSPGLLRFLVQKGADANEHLAANSSTTPLSIARDSNTPDAVDALVKSGAK